MREARSKRPSRAVGYFAAAGIATTVGMLAELTHRDLLLCVVAVRQQAVDEARLESVIAQWLARPEQPLAELVEYM